MTKLLKAFLFGSILLMSTNIFSQEETEKKPAKEAPKHQTKFQEVVIMDSTSAKEILKRAVNWVKVESNRFVKSNGVTTGSKAECVATFTIKPKELNPQADYTGNITMHVSIECKENKYRYVISQLKHTSTNGQATGGSIDNIIPDCGSMSMPDITWKKIKGEALKSASMIISELKEGMYKSADDPDDKW